MKKQNKTEIYALVEKKFDLELDYPVANMIYKLAYEQGKQAEQNRIIEIIDKFWKSKWSMHWTMASKNSLIEEIKQGEHTK